MSTPLGRGAGGWPATEHPRTRAAAVPLVVLLLVTGCASQQDFAPQDGSSSSSIEGQSEGQREVELVVLEALEDYPYGRAAVYEPSTSSVLVTIWTDGQDLSDDELRAIRLDAERAAGDVAVTITVSEESAPRAVD